MPDNNTGDNSNNGDGKPQGQEGTQPKGDDTQKMIPEASFAAVSDKYKAEKARADALQAKIDEANRKKEEETGEYKSLYEKEKEKAAQLEAATKLEKKATTFKLAAIKAGVVDVDDVLKLTDIEKLDIADDGTWGNAEAYFAKLKEAKAYLFPTTISKQNLGNGTNPTNDGKPTFTQDQLRDHVFYKEHEKDIDQALKEGRVV